MIYYIYQVNLANGGTLMNKDEILMKSRQEYQKEDEREIYITTQGFMYGAVGMAIVFFILVFLKLFLKGQRIDDI